jgi:hypothetical protein
MRRLQLIFGKVLVFSELERARGIEPTSEAWEARNKILKTLELAALNGSQEALNWKAVGK